jgi:outer membrane protein assembly factor BamB
MIRALAFALSSVPFAVASAQGDHPSTAYDVLTGTLAPAVDRGLCAASNGDLTVLGGELRDGYTSNSTVHVAFVRAIERTTGVERWRFVHDPSERTLAVAVDASAQRVYAITRKEVDGLIPGADHLLVFDASNGNVLLDVATPLVQGQVSATSDVDALAVSPAGDQLVRLDFDTFGFTRNVRTVAYDTTTGVEAWRDERTGIDPIERRTSTQNASLAISPDGATVYVSFVTNDPTGFGYKDSHVLSLDATDGSENWLRSLALANVDDQVSRPVVTPDSTGIFVVAETFPAGPTVFGPLLRLDAADGSTVWSAPVDNFAFAIAVNPNGTRVVVGGFSGNGTFPNGTDAALQCFDTTTGASSWSQTYPTVDLTEDVVDIRYSPDGRFVHASLFRTEMNAPWGSFVGLLNVAGNNGAPSWQTTFQVDTDDFVEHHWLDAVETSPTTSLVSMGQTVTDPFDESGLGNDQRRAHDADTGALLWDFTVFDTLPQHSDAAFRVWFEPGDAHFLVWRREAIANGLQQFRLDRHDAQSGALVSSLVVPDIGAIGVVFFKPNVSPDGAYVAIERGGSASSRRLSVYEIQTGALVFERNFGTLISEVLTAWDPNAPRVHWATRAAVGHFGCADVQLGQTVFEVAVNATGPLGGAIVPQGLAVHPVTGDQVASYESIPYLNPPGTNFIVARDRDTGVVLWSFSSSNANTTRFRRDHRDLSNLVTQAPYEELTTLRFSADGTRLYATDTFQTGQLTRARGAAFDFASGSFLWIASELEGLGHNGRTIDCTLSKDGRFFHVLGEGRGPISTNPMRTHVTTIDAQTGALLWSGKLPGDNARARRIESLGAGGRVAVLATFDTDSTTATGGYLAVLDAENGTELWRHEHTSSRGDLCDFAVAADEAVVLVGSTHLGGTNVDALVRRLDRRSLTQGPDQMSLSGGGHVEMHVDFDVANAGDIHVVVGTLSGTAPGLALANGFNLPLNYDAYTDISLLYANSPLFVNSIGVLDVNGDTRARVFVPTGSFGAFAGLPFSYAALAIDPIGGVSATSNPVFLTMLP